MSNIPQSLVTQHAARRARGFSIVELMVAITLALIVTAAVMAAFLGSRSSFMNTTGTAAVSDNGRFALDFLQTAVRGAGYMACNTTHSQLTLLQGMPSSVYYNYGQPLGGYEANNTVSNSYTVTEPPVTPDASSGDWLASSGPAWPGGGLDPALAGTVIKNSDVLVVYSTLRTTSPPAIVTNIANGATSFTVLNPYNLAANQIAAISDCARDAGEALDLPCPGPAAGGRVAIPQLRQLLRALVDAGLVLPREVGLLAGRPRPRPSSG